MGYLRMKAGVHYPTDVIAGYTPGAAIGLIIPVLHKNNQANFALFTHDETEEAEPAKSSSNRYPNSHQIRWSFRSMSVYDSRRLYAFKLEVYNIICHSVFQFFRCRQDQGFIRRKR